MIGVTATNGSLGNLLDDGVRTYEYDHANRLVEVVSGTLTTTFTYNGDGHRMAKAVNGATTTYVVAVLGLSQVLVETTAGESIVYLYGHDLLAEEDGSAWAWHLGDGLGSVRQLADGDGDVTLAQGYTPFGVPMWDAGSGATGYGFTGERWEAYNQLLFLRARYYEPGTGRFVSSDTVIPNFAKPSTLNVFLYVGNNPVNYFDPSGHYPDCLTHPSSCPLPPSGKVWKYLGYWRVTGYGHADHEQWPRPDETTGTEIHWLGENGELQTAFVNSDWLENVRGQGTAGKLTISNENGYRVVWLKCPKGGIAENTQILECRIWAEPSNLGAAGRRVACNPCPEIPTYEQFLEKSATICSKGKGCRHDVEKGDTVCIAGRLPLVKVMECGFGPKESRKDRTEWLDMFVGLHGPKWKSPGFRNIWVLESSPFPETCYEWLPCPD